MADPAITVPVLVVQFWIHDVEPIRSALRDAGIDPRIRRVDIEPALHAALSWGRYEVVIYDPATPTISREAVEACLRASRREVPLVIADDLATLGERTQRALLARRS